MYSINRLFFFSLGSVCFLLVPVFWLSLALDFSALENFVVKLSTTEFVGYPIPELLGSTKGENVVDQVLRIKVFFTVLIVAYSLLFIGLSYLEGATRRIRFCARGISIPLFCLILGFWLKFIHDDHIISKLEKKELFQYTIIFLVISVLFFAYSFHSKKKVKPTRFSKSKKNESTKPSPEVEGVAGKPPTDNEAPSTGGEVTPAQSSSSSTEEEVPTPESTLPPPLPEQAPVPEDKSVLPPPISSLLSPLEEKPAVSTESIAESYKFPSESEESPENQPEDSSLDAEADNTEELKPPPF